jgi:hypothetical protein
MSRIVDLVVQTDEKEVLDIVFDQDFEFAKQRLGLVDGLFKFDGAILLQCGFRAKSLMQMDTNPLGTCGFLGPSTSK